MTRDEWHAESASAQATVSCPGCKAPVGVPCSWGATNTGDVHASRRKRYRKVADKAQQRSERTAYDLTH